MGILDPVHWRIRRFRRAAAGIAARELDGSLKTLKFRGAEAFTFAFLAHNVAISEPTRFALYTVSGISAALLAENLQKPVLDKLTNWNLPRPLRDPMFKAARVGFVTLLMGPLVTFGGVKVVSDALYGRGKIEIRDDSKLAPALPANVRLADARPIVRPPRVPRP